MFWSKKYVLVLVLTCSTVLNSQLLLEGDTAAVTGDTFSFEILAKTLNAHTGDLYVGRNVTTAGGDADDVKQYAVSVVQTGRTQFIPLATEKASVNGVAGADNPLFGEQISTLGLLGSGPLVVRTDATQNLYFIASGSASAVSVLKIEDVKDAQGAVTVDGSTTNGILKVAGAGTYVFAAVKVNAGSFGVSGAGIALIQSTGKALEQIAAVTGDTGVKAMPINLTTAELLIANSLTVIDVTIVDMHWDSVLQRLYICVKATGNAAGTDGARGVLVAYIEGVGGVAKLKFSEFAPAAAFNGTTYIVGGVGERTVADIQKVRTMQTSTGVSYLIALGNSAGELATTTVSALPLVNKKSASTIAGDALYLADTTQGTLASSSVSVGTNLKEYFQTYGETSVFIGRGFQVPATLEAHLTAQTDTAAQVGGAVASGVVLDMQVHQDTVYVAVDGADDEVRVYSSQALFDAYGAIKAWTKWHPVMRPVTGTNEVYGIGYQPSIGHLYTMEGAVSGSVKKVKTSLWTKGSQDGLLGGSATDASVGFESLIGSAFSKENGGIQGLFDFPKETLGFKATDGSRLSMMIATGYKKIMLVETGQDNGTSNFVPNVGSFSHVDNITITDGVLNTPRTENTKIITISGGVLDTVGAISTATIINDDTNGGYILVGGVGGVAILRATTGGAGWAAGNLQKAFENIGTNKSFIAIGSYTHVRKVIADGQFLYVLTNKTFDRIPASQLDGAITITPTVLATPEDLGLQAFDSFSDVLVSSKLALLATSKGLYRVGNGGNITDGANAAAVGWTKITLSEGPTPVTRLVAASTAYLEKDFAQQTGGGMVYVLASSVGEQLSSVYRFTVLDISGSEISATTVERIPDDTLSTVVGPYGHLGGYRNYFTTDGSLPVVTRSYYNTTAALAQAFPADLIAGSPVYPKRMKAIPLASGQTEIGKLVRNSALGSKIIPTNDGSLILE